MRPTDAGGWPGPGPKSTVAPFPPSTGAAGPVPPVGSEGTVVCSTLPEVDFVVSAIVGVSGLEATHAAILAGKPVGLANKECMVAAGEILTAAARERNVPILPIDSEHNAVHQCMRVGATIGTRCITF